VSSVIQKSERSIYFRTLEKACVGHRGYAYSRSIAKLVSYTVSLSYFSFHLLSLILAVHNVVVEFCTHLSFYPSSEEQEARGVDNNLLGEFCLEDFCRNFVFLYYFHFTFYRAALNNFIRYKSGSDEYKEKQTNITKLTLSSTYINRNIMVNHVSLNAGRSSREKGVRLSVRLSVCCLSVCLSNAWIVTRRKKNKSRFLYDTKDHLA